MSKNHRLDGEGVALVTGASAGIGVALATQLAQKGYRLLLIARRKDRLETLAQELGGNATTFAQDLSKPNAAKKVLAFVEEKGMDVSLLINNAGFGWDGETADMPEEKVHQMIGLNITTLTEMCRLFLPRLEARGGGGVINISSVAGYSPMPRFAVYSATKAYVNSFSQALAIEAAPKNVHVLCACPGGTSTEFAQVSGREEDKIAFLKMTAEEVAKAALKAYEKGEIITATGVVNQVASKVIRMVPETLLLKAMDLTMKVQGR